MNVLKRIEKQVKLIDELVKELRFETSYRGVERLVQLILQALLDLGLMIISALGGRTPKSYSEIGVILHEIKVINSDEAKLLKSMAGLRNILVHLYAVVDREKILKFAKKLHEDAPRLAYKMFSRVSTRDIDPIESVDEIVDRLREVLKGRVKAAFLFGGRIKGYTLKGDYDIAVYFGRDYGLLELGELVIDIANALKVNEDKVNVVCLDSADPELILEAVQGIPIIMDSQETLVDLKVKALINLLDVREAKI